jgi:hypothetical protein
MGAFTLLVGHDQARPIDAVFINSPLKDYDVEKRFNDFTLPVLGLGYIATYAASQGFNVAVLDGESCGLGPTAITAAVRKAKPRWVGFNLLAPTYVLAARIATLLPDDIQIMLGGHQAKAMPLDVIADPAFPRIDALVLGEGEYICSAILADTKAREELPGVMYRDRLTFGARSSRPNPATKSSYWTAPDINKLPMLDRRFLVQV